MVDGPNAPGMGKKNKNVKKYKKVIKKFKKVSSAGPWVGSEKASKVDFSL